MADIQLNRARLGISPMAMGFTKANVQTQTLADGVVASAPLVALAYSYAILDFEGNATHANESISVECNGYGIDITLDGDGKASLSLLPFIRMAVLGAVVLDNPLYCETGADFQQNNYRGYIDVSITEANALPVAMRVHFIFGNYVPKGEEVTDLYFDYLPDGETWVNVDAASHYDANGVPVEFEDNWCNINEIVAEDPDGDFVLPLEVAWFCGGDDIRFSTINYHFHYDCRVANIVKVRWLDTNGNINIRKFTRGGRSHGGASGDSWMRPHTTKAINLGYDRGKDQWANITANETITLGDDAIPMTHFDWLKTLTSSAAVEVFKDNAWVRVNFGDASVECDPRKQTFSMSLTLILPTDDVQQF